MKYSDDLKEIAQHLVGRKLSHDDIGEYISFLQGSDKLSAERREEIKTDIANIVLENPGLAKQVAEEHMKQTGDEKKKKPASDSLFLGVTSYILPQHQINLVATLSKNNQLLASAPDVYSYLKTLETHILKGTHAQITEARNRISTMRLRMPLLTSTRLFYNLNSQDIKVVHNYGGSAKIQVHKTIKLSYNLQPQNREYRDAMSVILGTKDSQSLMRRIFNLVYVNSIFKSNIFPNNEQRKNITCGTVYFDSEGIHLFKCGDTFKEKWGNGLYKEAPKKK